MRQRRWTGRPLNCLWFMWLRWYRRGGYMTIRQTTRCGTDGQPRWWWHGFHTKPDLETHAEYIPDPADPEYTRFPPLLFRGFIRVWRGSEAIKRS